MKLQRHHLVVGGWWCIAAVDMDMWALSCMYTPRATMFMFEHVMFVFEHVMYIVMRLGSSLTIVSYPGNTILPVRCIYVVELAHCDAS